MIDIKSAELARARRDIARINPAINAASVRAINRTAQWSRTLAGREIRSQVVLQASYVNRHLRITQRASIARQSAVITARARPTRLARFGANQLTRRAPHGESGDTLRGIPASRKQAGVSVRVKRGAARSRMRGAFLLPLRNSNVMGVFVRTGKNRGDIQHLYGPSVSQVFTDVREQIQPRVSTRLANEFTRNLRLRR